MTSFKDMKKSSQNTVLTLSKEVEKLNKGGESFKDDRFWNITRDKSGNGYAVVRFLPPVENEDVPWVRIFSHGFKGPGGNWFIENCPTTLGKKCPVCEANGELWNSGLESDKEIARARKRKLRYISNILVISDPSNRENEGKIFLFNYGKKIFDKITESMTPQYEGEEPINPFDFWTGRNFKIKVKTIGEYPNYDSSEFASPSALFEGDDAKLEMLWKSEYPLKEFVDPSQFKSYDELQNLFLSVVNKKASMAKPSVGVTATVTEQQRPSSIKESKPPFESNTEEEDGNLDYFKKLAEDTDD